MTPGELRARLRPIASNERDRFCGVKASSVHPTLQVRRQDGARKARFTGVMLCGHIWSCPVCSRVLRAKRAAKVEAAVKGAGGGWGMLTVTMRHQVGPDLRPQLRGLMAAWRRTRQGGAVQALWSEKVEASVRATETTHSRANGWHPHSHVLLHGSNWTRSERQVLFDRWRRVVVDELGTVATPTAEHGLHWTPWFDASSAPTAYLTKVGLELSGAGKEGRWGSRSAWAIAEGAARGDAGDVRLWRDFCHGTKGTQAIRLDDRAAEHARQWLEAQQLAGDRFKDGQLEEQEGQPRTREVELARYEVDALRARERLHPTIIEDIVREAEKTGDPEAALRMMWRSVDLLHEEQEEHQAGEACHAAE